MASLVSDLVLGFTGTRYGMTIYQRDAFVSILRQMRPSVFRHGDCKGADAQAHDVVRALLPACLIDLNPPTGDGPWRAYCKADSEQAPKTFMVRNRHIVKYSTALVATPMHADEGKGGTWNTVRFARELGRPVWLILPGGAIVEERMEGL